MLILLYPRTTQKSIDRMLRMLKKCKHFFKFLLTGKFMHVNHLKYSYTISRKSITFRSALTNMMRLLKSVYIND
jgi:hypothetical protein